MGVRVTGAVTAEEIAQRVTVGLVVVRDGETEWSNAAARALVERHGGSWTADDSAVRRVVEVAPGAVRALVRWPPPGGGVRLWQVSCTALAPPGRLLYEIADHTAPLTDDRPLGMADPHWRLDRLEALARMGSWVWHVAEGRVEWSGALLAMFGYPDGEVLDYDTFRSLVHPDDLPMIDAAIGEGMATGLPFTYTHRMAVGGAIERIFECHGEVFRDPAASRCGCWAPRATSPRSTAPAPSWPTWPSTTR
jgi:PAS domain-containing protein